MKKLPQLLANIMLLLPIISCSKSSKQSDCETWVIRFWEGNARKDTVGYAPYNVESKICGNYKDIISIGKTLDFGHPTDSIWIYGTYLYKK